MKSWTRIAAAALCALASPVLAQDGPPREVPASAPAEPDAIPLYGAQTPGSAASEVWGAMGPGVLGVRNVTRPTLTPVLPDPAKATGAAVKIGRASCRERV